MKRAVTVLLHISWHVRAFIVFSSRLRLSDDLILTRMLQPTVAEHVAGCIVAFDR